MFFYHRKQENRPEGRFSEKQLVLASHACKALAAIHGAVLTGLERHFRLFAAVSANSGVHLSFRSRCVLASIAASLAALGLVHKAFLSIELLLTGGEHKFCAAFLADQSLVFVHVSYLTCIIVCPATE